ncbi:MAG: hypothetical protein J0L60_06835 [Ignavibacteria bacterium]|nr:hypothetical protein [Ignavibacteria bacterium]
MSNRRERKDRKESPCGDMWVEIRLPNQKEPLWRHVGRNQITKPKRALVATYG